MGVKITNIEYYLPERVINNKDIFFLTEITIENNQIDNYLLEKRIKKLEKEGYIEKYTAYIKLLVDNTATRPFSMGTIWPLPGQKREEIAEKIKALINEKDFNIEFSYNDDIKKILKKILGHLIII